MSHNPERRVSYGPGLPTDPLWLKAMDRIGDGLDRGAQRLFSSMATIARGGLSVMDRVSAIVDRLLPVSLENQTGESLLSVIDKREERRERAERVATAMIRGARSRTLDSKTVNVTYVYEP